MRFSNNAMDVLTLPLPGSQGPAKYDQEVILFTQREGDFKLEVGTAAAVRSWKSRSTTVGGAFTMSSGRPWGVF
jgi:hypothetical protein